MAFIPGVVAKVTSLKSGPTLVLTPHYLTGAVTLMILQ